MVLEAPKRWTLQAVLFARIVLASTLLLNACALIFRHGPSKTLISVVEVLLGIVIAEGWHLRYAAGLVLLGALSASLLPVLLHRASAGSHVPISIALILPSAVLLCFGRNDGLGSSAVIRETRKLSSSDSSGVSAIFRDADVEVTVRLETGLLSSPHKQRCIVTFHDLSGDPHKTEKEAWYARDDR